MMNVLTRPLNRYIDHTALKPNLMDIAFEGVLEEAVKHNFYSVCVSPYIAEATVKALAPYPETKVCTVIAFPNGNVPLEFKLREIEYFINKGIDEVDWVLHYGEVLNENWLQVQKEMEAVSRVCREANIVSKCIIETSVMRKRDWLERLFLTVANTGVDFIKTSTGFTGEGARLEDIKFWNSIRNGQPSPKIKASGGIKNAEQALAFIAAGADRLGLSASVEVMEQMEQYNVMAQPKTFTGGEKEG
jgi:deoxyribose-phosphate aldolase